MDYRDDMAESSTPGFGDLMALFGGSNPFGSITKTLDQFKRGVNDFLEGVEQFNKTMESLNGVTIRVNRLLDEVEGPVMAMMPQVTRSIKTADTVITQLSGPVEKLVPGMARLADTLSSPVFANLPNELAGFLDTLGDLAKRLQPLTQMAETAGSMFGLRSLNALRGGSGRQPPAPMPAPAPAPMKKAPPASKPAAKKAPARKAPAKKTPAKKTPAKKTAAKRTAAKGTSRSR